MKPQAKPWNAHWIAPIANDDSLSRFGRWVFSCSVRVEDLSQSHILRISADSRYLLIINDKIVGNGPVRSQAQRWHYDEYDVTSSLVKGENRIGVIVTYYGEGNAFWRPALTTEQDQGKLGTIPVLIVEGTTDQEPENTWILTDDSWQVTPLVSRSLAPSGHMDGIPVEIIDANMQNVSLPWSSHAVRSIKPQATQKAAGHHLGSLTRSQPPVAPYGYLLPRPIRYPEAALQSPSQAFISPSSTAAITRPNPVDTVLDTWDALEAGYRPEETFTPVNAEHITVDAKADYSQAIWIDMGKVVAGYLSLKLEAPQGTVLDILYRERRPGSGDRGFMAIPRAGLRYIARGENDYLRTLEIGGFRYLCIIITSTQNTTVTLSDIVVQEEVFGAVGEIGLISDDQEIQNLYNAGVRTVALNTLDSFTDCPTREQRAWVGDAVVHTKVNLVSSADWRPSTRHVQLSNAPRLDGILPMVVASHDEQDSGFTIPDWSLHWIHGVHEIMMYTGDEKLIRDLAPTVRGILNWYAKYQQEDGTIAYVPEWNLVDWSSLFLTGRSSILTALWARALQEYAEISAYLGNQGEVFWAENLHSAARRGYESFWDEARGTYRDHDPTGVAAPVNSHRAASQIAGAASILSGLVPQERYERIISWISDPTHLVHRGWVGDKDGLNMQKVIQQNQGIQTIDWNPETECVVAEPFGAYLVHEAYSKAGAIQELRSSLSRWSDFLTDGYDTFWERWGWGSPVHGWSSCPTADIVTSLLGIYPSKPGYEEVEINPAYSVLSTIEATVPTPAGNISLRIDYADDASSPSVSLTSPVATKIHTPSGDVVDLSAGQYFF